MSTPIKFGKYKGRTVEELLVSDRGYLEWLAAQEFFKDYLIYDKVMSSLGLTEGDVTIKPKVEGSVNFGKYRGQSVSTLLADVEYCKWVINQEFFKKNGLYGQVAKLLGVDPTPPPPSKPISAYEVGSSGIAVAGENGTVGFGKYTGKPIATLLSDVDYCKWVMGQDWFAKNKLFDRVKAVVEGASKSTASSSSKRAYSPEPTSPCTPEGYGDW